MKKIWSGIARRTTLSDAFDDLFFGFGGLAQFKLVSIYGIGLWVCHAGDYRAYASICQLHVRESVCACYDGALLCSFLQDTCYDHDQQWSHTIMSEKCKDKIDQLRPSRVDRKIDKSGEKKHKSDQVKKKWIVDSAANTSQIFQSLDTLKEIRKPHIDC